MDFKIHNTRKLVDEKIAEIIPNPGVRSFLLKNVYWKEKGVLDYRFNLTSLTENNHEVGKALPVHALFEGKVLFISAGNSGYILNDDHALIKLHFPNSSIDKIPNVGHWLHAESPELFYELVMKFLR